MYNRILFATDFDEVGLRAAQHAWDVSKQFDASLYLVHVIEPIPAYAYPGFPGFAQIEDELEDHAREEMAKVGDKVQVPLENQFIRIGATKNEVLNIAKELDIDLIVVGSHGRHGLALLIGSTSNAILHSAECDVLTVRPK